MGRAFRHDIRRYEYFVNWDRQTYSENNLGMSKRRCFDNVEIHIKEIFL